VKFIRPCSEPVGKNPRNRSAGATSISSFPLLMEPIVVAVGCGAAGAASDLKINPPRLIKKGLWEQRYARVLPFTGIPGSGSHWFLDAANPHGSSLNLLR
jgi:hypothetical protein